MGRNLKRTADGGPYAQRASRVMQGRRCVIPVWQLFRRLANTAGVERLLGMGISCKRAGRPFLVGPGRLQEVPTLMNIQKLEI